MHTCYEWFDAVDKGIELALHSTQLELRRFKHPRGYETGWYQNYTGVILTNRGEEYTCLLTTRASEVRLSSLLLLLIGGIVMEIIEGISKGSKVSLYLGKGGIHIQDTI